MSLRVLHLVSSNRWSGAAAPALAEVEALRAAGVDASYAYVGNYKLERKVGPAPWAHPVIDREQNPVSFARSLARVRRLIHERNIDIVHAHLTYDHWIAHFATRKTPVAVARTFHSRRAIRNDFITRRFIGRSKMLFVVNAALADAPALQGREVLFTPPPIDLEQFQPQGPEARATYGIAAEDYVFCAIGKLTDDRRFEDVLQTFSILRKARPPAPRLRLMIIGNGPHREALRQHALSLGIGDDVIWAGYHQEDLAEHYRAANALLFTARGSDEGHRAILEAMACGVVPLSYPLEGVATLLGDSAPHLVSDAESPDSLAARAAEIIPAEGDLRGRMIALSREYAYERAAQRLLGSYETRMAAVER